MQISSDLHGDFFLAHLSSLGTDGLVGLGDLAGTDTLGPKEENSPEVNSLLPGASLLDELGVLDGTAGFLLLKISEFFCQ